MSETQPTGLARLKTLIVGGARNLYDRTIYHKLSLAAFLAWVGLGSDGLSSSCYGPAESYVVLGQHAHLGIIVALITAATVLIISASYSQIIEQFPSGGGGYVVASKLLSPHAGALAGCALLLDYVLTIAISIASGTDALFSMNFVPEQWQSARLGFAIAAVLGMTLLNIRGVRESVIPLVPIFLVFVLAHLFIIGYAVATHAGSLGEITDLSAHNAGTGAAPPLGLFAAFLLVMKSYTMGAGTYTGIEAVSNGMAILREPRVHTAKRTMTYMAISLAVMAAGLTITFLLYHMGRDPAALQAQLKDKTLNALMLERATSGWGAGWGATFVVVTLVSEAAILLIAAQTGFLGGPRVLANMAMDRWLPARLSMLSDRLVTRNGVLIMSGAALVTMVLTRGSVSMLLVLYAINVFITFALSQTGMVRHWWISRQDTPKWRRKLAINGLGLVLTLFILACVVVVKFGEGGWATLLATGTLMVVVSLIRRHYNRVAREVSQFNKLAEAVLLARRQATGTEPPPAVPCDPNAKTAVLLVGGFNGMGLHSLQNVVRYFGDVFKNFIFINVGIVDAGNFKGAGEVRHLEAHIRADIDRYVDLMRREGYHAEGLCSVGTDISDEVAKMAPEILRRFPQSVFFAGQLIFSKESVINRWLHNNLVFAVQKRLYRQGIPFVIMPFRV